MQGLDDALNARVVRRHAIADEAEGRGHLLDEVNLYLAPGLFHQDIGGVDAGWASTDDCYLQGLIHAV